MTLSRDDKKTLSDVRFERAIEFLDDAKANLAENRLKTSVNRSYYSSLCAIRALLVLEGANPESHSGAVTVFSLRFIKTKLLPVTVVKDHKLLLSRRTDVDYGDFASIDRDEAEDSVRRVESIIGAISALRLELIKELQ